MFKGNYISFAGYSIKQHDTVEYLGFQLGSELSGKALVSKVLRKINAKLKFLYWKSIYIARNYVETVTSYKNFHTRKLDEITVFYAVICLTPAFRRLLSNAIIQPHFDCGCSSWFPLLKKNLKIKLKKAQNKHIRFCLNLSLRSRIDPSHFRKIKFRPARDRVEHWIVNIVFKY